MLHFPCNTEVCNISFMLHWEAKENGGTKVKKTLVWVHSEYHGIFVYILQSLHTQFECVPPEDYSQKLHTWVCFDHSLDKNYSKNPWALGICTIPNEVGLVGQEPTRLKVEWVLGLQDPLNWELCEFSMARGPCFYPMNVFIV